MSWSIVVARPFGVPLRVHASFVLVLLLGAVQWGLPHGAWGAAFGVLVTLGIFVCVVLHELGHSVAARAFGIRTKQILLLPIGGIAELEGKPRRPLHDLVIAIAGPLVNIVIAAALLLVLGTGIATGTFTMPSTTELAPSLMTFGLVLFVGNGMLALFNLLPFFPLDGGRALRALLAFRMGEHRSLRVAAGVGQFGAVVLGMWALFAGHLLLAVIAALVFFSASAARTQSIVPELVAGLRARDVCEQGTVVFDPGTTLDQAVQASIASPQTVFPVALGTDVIGIIDRERLRAAALQGGAVYVSGLMARDWPRVSADLPLADALELLPGRVAAAVYDGESLIGFLSAAHVYNNVLPVLAGSARATTSRDTTRTEVA